MLRSVRTLLGQIVLASLVVALATPVLWHANLMASGSNGEGTLYTVARGDSLRAIGAKYGVDAGKIAAMNDLGPRKPLYRGQQLTVPVLPTPALIVKPAAVDIPANATTYTVKRGDSLRAISRATGASVEDIIAANGLNPRQPLYRGQILIIPHAAPAGLPAPSDIQAQPEATATPVAEEEPAATETPVAEEEVEPIATPVAEEEVEPTATPVAEEEAEPAATPVAEEEAEPTATPVAEEEAEPTATPVAEEEPAPTATPVAEEEAAEEEAVAEEEAAEEAELLDIIDTALAASDFTLLVAAVQAAGLGDALRGEGPFTVFAPTDAAFRALPMGALDALLLAPEGDLAQILLYHVLAGKVLSSDLSDGLTVATLQGGEIVFTVTDDGAQVNGVAIVVADIKASNGVIHVIDAVLLPSP